MNIFFSACGKTNLAMLRPTGIPGYKVECIGKSRKIFKKMGFNFYI